MEVSKECFKALEDCQLAEILNIDSFWLLPPSPPILLSLSSTHPLVSKKYKNGNRSKRKQAYGYTEQNGFIQSSHRFFDLQWPLFNLPDDYRQVGWQLPLRRWGRCLLTEILILLLLLFLIKTLEKFTTNYFDIVTIHCFNEELDICVIFTSLYHAHSRRYLCSAVNKFLLFSFRLALIDQKVCQSIPFQHFRI